jgi:Tfp pilus assembly protein PilX
MKVNNQQGFVLPMTMMMIVFFAILLAGLLPLVSAQFRFTRFDQDRINAQFAAEAGAKNAINALQHQIDAIKPITATNINQLNKSLYTEDIVKNKSNCEMSWVAQSLPNNCFTVTITSTGFVNGKKHSVDVLYNLKLVTKITTEDLFNQCDYSNGKSWNIEKEYENEKLVRTYAYPPNSGACQVLFKNCPLKPENNVINLSYNAACKKFPTDGSATGYGIYYGATGTADNMTGYVFQYDPGAFKTGDEEGSFFVKKVKQQPNAPDHAYDNEWDDNKVVKKAVPARWELVNNKWKWVNEQPAVLGGYYNTYYSKGDNFRTSCWQPFQPNTLNGKIVTDQQLVEAGDDGTVRITLRQLRDAMDKLKITDLIDQKVIPAYVDSIEKLRWYTSYWNENKKKEYLFDISANHNITINITDDPLNPGKKRQKIFCDGVLILNFVDNTTKCPIDFDTTTYSGLRVWNAKVDFSINAKDTVGHKNSKPEIVWQKHN